MLYAGKLRPAGGYQMRYKWGGLWDGFRDIVQESGVADKRTQHIRVKNRSL